MVEKQTMKNYQPDYLFPGLYREGHFEYSRPAGISPWLSKVQILMRLHFYLHFTYHVKLIFHDIIDCRIMFGADYYYTVFIDSGSSK